MTNHLTGYLKFYVREKAAEEGDEVDPSSSDPIGNFAADESIPAVPTTKAVHNVGSVVTCDECGMSPIVGIRYKCAVREDYDLCEKCERSKLQPYPMVKIVNPDQAPQALVYVFADHQAAGAPGPAPTEGPFWQRGMRQGIIRLADHLEVLLVVLHTILTALMDLLITVILMVLTMVLMECLDHHLPSGLLADLLLIIRWVVAPFLVPLALHHMKCLQPRPLLVLNHAVAFNSAVNARPNDCKRSWRRCRLV